VQQAVMQLPSQIDEIMLRKNVSDDYALDTSEVGDNAVQPSSLTLPALAFRSRLFRYLTQ
jgi:hypothetical protein